MKLSRAIVIAFAIATMIVLANCQSATLEPEAIEANDMCAFCRMSISEKRYAAELIGQGGEAYKFDDIGCMANFRNQKKDDGSIRASFVMDFESREWLTAEDSFYVRSSEFKTPMSGNIAAFKVESNAQAAAAKYQGTMLSFTELAK